MERPMKTGTVVAAAAACSAIWLVFAVPRTMGWSAAHLRVEELVITASALTAYVISLICCRGIALEYERHTWMRASWLAFAGNALFSIARHLVDNSFPGLIWPGYWEGGPASVLRQAFSILAFLGLLIGMLTNWQAFRALGLGFRMLPRDRIALALVFLLLTGILCFREGLTEAKSPSLLAWKLQQASHIVLAGAAAAGILSHRLCVQMGGGRLAAALRWIIVYTVTRCALVFKWVVLPAEWNSQPTVSLLSGAVFYSVPWIFALATVIRSQMTAEVALQFNITRARLARKASIDVL
jgi:hypothetical protein